ncbi:MAG: sulfotransferase [Cyanobacteria bacterium P01_H01_bin.35]
MELEKFIGLTPTRLIWQTPHSLIEWLDMRNITFSEPFLNQTIARCLRDEPNRLKLQTNIDELSNLCQIKSGLEPTGFIFHTQRCGSTLISQALATLPQNIVLSEPRIIAEVLGGNIFASLDFLAIQKSNFWPTSTDLTDHSLKDRSQDKIKELKFQFEDTVFAEKQKITYLQQVISVLVQQRLGCEKNYFIKFSSEHILQLPLIKKAFPNTPWIFIYRDPIEVVVSILKSTWAF